MFTKIFITTGALWSLIGVVAHALSSHPIKPKLEANNSLDNFNLAANFMLFHGISLLFIALALQVFPKVAWHWIGIGFILGSILFQGSIFIKSVSTITSLGPLTPIGGLILMISWLLLIVTASMNTL